MELVHCKTFKPRQPCHHSLILKNICCIWTASGSASMIFCIISPKPYSKTCGSFGRISISAEAVSRFGCVSGTPDLLETSFPRTRFLRRPQVQGLDKVSSLALPLNSDAHAHQEFEIDHMQQVGVYWLAAERLKPSYHDMAIVYIIGLPYYSNSNPIYIEGTLP